MKKEPNDFDWFAWAGIATKPKDQLISDAQKMGIPIFESDTEKDLYDRILVIKSARINKIIAVVTVVSAIASVLSAVVSSL